MINLINNKKKKSRFLFNKKNNGRFLPKGKKAVAFETVIQKIIWVIFFALLFFAVVVLLRKLTVI